MSECKGSNLVFIRKIVQAAGPEKTEALLTKLSSEEKSAFQSALPSAWVSTVLVSRLFEIAADILFPGDSQGLRLLGRELARDQFRSGIYRAFLRLSTVAFVISQVATIWQIYHRQGRATCTWEKNEKKCDIVVVDYPEFPAAFQEEVAGFLWGMAELTGVKNIRILRDSANPQAWKWTILWE
ncbi:MAG: hypothetical protein HGA76_06295 [Candidatus Firestonebacteria bacterium]|nr:hypothetical protein [Candidatus Firestonebacteria bacterium]